MNEPEFGPPEFWARERPQAVAVIKGDASLTYGRWNDQANRVADALSGLGLRQGDRLGMRFRLAFPWFVIQRALQKLGVIQVALGRARPGRLHQSIRRSASSGSYGSRLASFKKPRQFEFVDRLPVNPMGKVLKTELRAPYWKGRERHV